MSCHNKQNMAILCDKKLFHQINSCKLTFHNAKAYYDLGLKIPLLGLEVYITYTCKVFFICEQ